MLELKDLHDRFGYDITESTFRDNRRILVPKDKVYFVLECLWRDYGFDMLVEMTAVDYLEYPGELPYRMKLAYPGGVELRLAISQWK